MTTGLPVREREGLSVNENVCDADGVVESRKSKCVYISTAADDRIRR